MLQDLLKKIHQFQEDVRREVDVDSMDLSRLETLLEEFSAPADIDVSELTLLKTVNTTTPCSKKCCLRLYSVFHLFYFTVVFTDID